MGPYEISDTVIQNVRLLRASKRLSMRELATLCASVGYPHLNETKLWNLAGRKADGVAREARRGVRIDEVFALAKALSVSVEYLITTHDCQTCHGAPPAGFVCATCGTGGAL